MSKTDRDGSAPGSPMGSARDVSRTTSRQSKPRRGGAQLSQAQLSRGYTRSTITSVRASHWDFTARSAAVCLTLLPGLALCFRHFRAY